MTPLIITSLSDLYSLSVDNIIDVRTPAEYAEDHIPGAINLPVLSNSPVSYTHLTLPTTPYV